MLSSVDDIHMAAYKFSVLSISCACIVEMMAEAPVYVGQVFCFVKLKVVLDTLHVMVRSVIFIVLVLSDKDRAIYAFGIAQLSSAFTIIVGNYLFFHIYIGKLKKYRAEIKRSSDGADETSKKEVTTTNVGYYENMDDFPFNSVLDMVPGVLPNSVSINDLI